MASCGYTAFPFSLGCSNPFCIYSQWAGRYSTAVASFLLLGSPMRRIAALRGTPANAIQASATNRRTDAVMMVASWVAGVRTGAPERQAFQAEGKLDGGLYQEWRRTTRSILIP